MRLGWDVIKRRAKEFSEEWKNETYEKGEAQSFYNDFFEIFGVRRRQVAVYERQVKSLDTNKSGFIDLFWPGMLIAEHKSTGKDLFEAELQAYQYFDWLPDQERPRFILTCDFQKWELTDLDKNGKRTKFLLADLHKHVEAFAFILGRKVSFGKQKKVNVRAAELMGRLHNELEKVGYTGADLELLLVRLLFCLFADDTGIFEPKDIFLQLIENDTKSDGSDVGPTLVQLFDILDRPEGERQTTLSDELQQFPYVNGDLFAKPIRTPGFNVKMRDYLLDACRFNWGEVSPAIFGSLFQSVMDVEEQEESGGFYTSEENIMKVIGGLFLDELEAELEAIKARRTGQDNALRNFQQRLSRLRFFDPACGCGNFLVIAYRELRRLELDCLTQLYGDQQLDPTLMSQITVDQFYGIEYKEFPCRIAEVAMWMMDHLANNQLNERFRANYARIPLKDSPHIHFGDALETDWADVLPPADCNFIMGNPPFRGAKKQNDQQRAQVRKIAALGGSGGTLDYVAPWFIKAGRYLAENKRIKIAFVATNSVTQGEQVAQLWPILFEKCGMEISFAHQTFKWGINLPKELKRHRRGRTDKDASVHVVIVGLAHHDNEPPLKRLFAYPDVKGDPIESEHKALTAYLFGADNGVNRHLVVKEESKPINGADRVRIGSKPIDGGYLIFTEAERSRLKDAEPESVELLRPYVGAKDYINGDWRWIAALQEIAPSRLRSAGALLERLRLVRAYRKGEIASKGKEKINSPGISARALAETPKQFHVTVIPKKPFLAIPGVSSENREYVPIGWLEPPVIPSNLVNVLLDASSYAFGILVSKMHMAWMAHIGGRLESRYRYSIGLVYDTFPLVDATADQREEIKMLAQEVLDARAKHETSSLADLYDPDTMPANLRKAHKALDKAVDQLYRKEPFENDRERVEHLFGLYEQMINSQQEGGRI